MRIIQRSRYCRFSLVAIAPLFGLQGCLDRTDEIAQDQESAGAAAVNRPPTITGSPPPAVLVGEIYSFQPDASDPDGDTLLFSIQNKPDWLAFDPASGLLEGATAAGIEGVYREISISVNDGKADANLPPFSVEVTQVALGSVTLSWTPPTQNSNGSPLKNLAGYRIYYGLSPGSYPNMISIDNPGIATYVVENLVPNTYYFVATSINSAGVESRYSNVTTRTIDPE